MNQWNTFVITPRPQHRKGGLALVILAVSFMPQALTRAQKEALGCRTN